MGNIYVKVTDKEGDIQESRGDFAFAVNIEQEKSKAIVQGEFSVENYMNLVQSTVRSLVKIGHDNEFPAFMLDTVFQESFRLAVKDILIENGYSESELEELEYASDEMDEEEWPDITEEHEGFDLEPYIEKIEGLKNDIRLKAFRKLCSSYHVSMGRTELQKQFEANILPKAKEIIAFISPELLESDLFVNPVIEYGVKTIEVETMIQEMKETLSMLHELSIVLEVSTLKEVITIQKEYHNARSK